MLISEMLFCSQLGPVGREVVCSCQGDRVPGRSPVCGTEQGMHLPGQQTPVTDYNTTELSGITLVCSLVGMKCCLLE